MVKIISEQYLELIDGVINHYKFYRVIRLNNGQAVCAHGRIGTENAAVNVYTDLKGQDKYWEKRKKGYLDAYDRYTGHDITNIKKAGINEAVTMAEQSEPEPSYDIEKYNNIVENITKLLNIVVDNKHREQVSIVYKRIDRTKSANYDDLKLLHDIWELYTTV